MLFFAVFRRCGASAPLCILVQQPHSRVRRGRTGGHVEVAVNVLGIPLGMAVNEAEVGPNIVARLGRNTVAGLVGVPVNEIVGVTVAEQTRIAAQDGFRRTLGITKTGWKIGVVNWDKAIIAIADDLGDVGITGPGLAGFARAGEDLDIRYVRLQQMGPGVICR